MKQRGFCLHAGIIAILCLTAYSNTHGAETLWNPASTYTIPSDGDTYYIDSTVTLTSLFRINSGAIFEIKSSGTLLNSDPGRHENNGTISVKGTLGPFIRFRNETSGVIEIVGGSWEVDGDIINDGIIFATIGTVTIDGEAILDNTIGGTLKVFGADCPSGITNGRIEFIPGEFLVIPSGSELIINSQAEALCFEDTTYTGDLTNNGTIVVFYGANLSGAGTLTNNGDLIDLNVDDFATLPANITIPAGFTLIVPEWQTIIAPGILTNLSPTSISISGDLYITDILKNGDGSNPGTIDINFPGRLILPGGTLQNAHAGSVINVNSGGGLYGYYGDVDITQGSFNLAAGGRFDNARGTNPGVFTITNGGEFSDTDDINLVGNLDIDFTWTLTEKASIHGYGNRIRFRPGGSIVIAGPNASLLLDDVVIDGIDGYQIRCTDDTTTLSIHNVSWRQDSTYTFSKGEFYVTGEWEIFGKGAVFSYESDQMSNIDTNGTMRFVHSTLNYNSPGSSNLTMADQSSKIEVEHGTIRAQQTCNLGTGNLWTKGIVTLQGDSLLNLSGLNDIQVTGNINRIGSVTY